MIERVYSKTPFSLLFLQLFFTSVTGLSQPNMATNSFEEGYKKSNPSISYQYDSEKQIHNYSNNWDFDKDGKQDQVYFVGTGGAHLYFFLRVILSADKVVRDFPFLQSDFPILPPDHELQKVDFDPTNSQTQFAVFDYGNDDGKKLFIKLDNYFFYTEKKNLKKKGIKTNLVIITFRNGKAVIEDFVSKEFKQKASCIIVYPNNND